MAQDVGKLLLRLTLGLLMLFHGIAKVTGSLDFIRRLAESHGLPSWTAYSVYIPELLAPVLLIVGWYSRVGAALILLEMLLILALVHRADFLLLSRSGAWAVETEMFYLMTALVVLLIGPGRYAINRR
jgi:putative oxidoreductase